MCKNKKTKKQQRRSSAKEMRGKKCWQRNNKKKHFVVGLIKGKLAGYADSNNNKKCKQIQIYYLSFLVSRTKVKNKFQSRWGKKSKGGILCLWQNSKATTTNSYIHGQNTITKQQQQKSYIRFGATNVKWGQFSGVHKVHFRLFFACARVVRHVMCVNWANPHLPVTFPPPLFMFREGVNAIELFAGRVHWHNMQSNHLRPN